MVGIWEGSESLSLARRRGLKVLAEAQGLQCNGQEFLAHVGHSGGVRRLFLTFPVEDCCPESGRSFVWELPSR